MFGDLPLLSLFSTSTGLAQMTLFGPRWYNSCYRSSIKMSHFEALYGYKPPYLPATLGLNSIVDVDTYLQ